MSNLVVILMVVFGFFLGQLIGYWIITKVAKF
jgi:uncharacterized protein YneF (UPF0154 family)